MAEDGIDISYEQMTASFGKTVWTRAHFARYLAEHGYVSGIEEAFLTFIGDDCRYFVPRDKVSPFAVTRLLRRYHGIPILAHPLLYHLSDRELRLLIIRLKAEGLIGIEVYYSLHTKEQEDYLLSIADEYDLLPGGGSDFHGSNKPDIRIGAGHGNLHIPYSVLENLRAEASRGDDSPVPDTRRESIRLPDVAHDTADCPALRDIIMEERSSS